MLGTITAGSTKWTRLKPSDGAGLRLPRPGANFQPCAARLWGIVHVRPSRSLQPVQVACQEAPPPQTPQPPSSNPPLEWVHQQVQVVVKAWQGSEVRQVLTQVMESSGVNAMLPPSLQPYALPVVLLSATLEAAVLVVVVRKVVASWFKSKLQMGSGDADSAASPGMADKLGAAVASAMGIPQEELEATIQGAAEGKKQLQRLRAQVEEAALATEAMQQRLKTTLAYREEELSNALETVAQLQEELNTVRSVVAVREEELDQVQVAALKKADEAMTALKESQRKVALLEAMVLALRGKLQEEEERTEQLTKAVQERDAKIKALESQRNELVGRVDELRAQLARRQEQLKDAVECCSSLEQQVEKLEAQSSALQSKVTKLEQRLQQQADEARQVAAAAEERLAVLQAQATKGEEALMKAQLDIQEREQEVEVLQQKAAQDKEQLCLKELELQQAEDMEQKLAAWLDQMAQERANELDEVRTRLQRELIIAQQKSEATQEELSTVKKELVGVMMQLLGSVSAVSDTLHSLPPDLRALLGSEAAEQQMEHQVRERFNSLQQRILDDQRALAALRESAMPNFSKHPQNNLARAEQKLMAANKALQTTLANPSASLVDKQQAHRDVQEAEADVEALYRSAVPLDMQQQERNLRVQLRDREMELSTLQAKLASQHQEGATLGQLLAEKLKAQADACEVDLTERLKQHEKDLNMWKESEQQLREQIKNLEQSWKLEVDMVQRALMKSNTTDSGESSGQQAYQIVIELRSVREQLATHSEQVKKLRALYEEKVAGAQANADKARSQVTLLSENVLRLEEELQDHESKVQSLRSAVGLPSTLKSSSTLDTIEVIPSAHAEAAVKSDTADRSATSGLPVASSSPATEAALSSSTPAPTLPEGTVSTSQWGRVKEPSPFASSSNGSTSADPSPTISTSSIFPIEEQLSKEVQAMARSLLGTAFGSKSAWDLLKQPPGTAPSPTRPSPATPTNGATSTSTRPSPATPTNGTTLPSPSPTPDTTSISSSPHATSLYSNGLEPAATATTSSSLATTGPSCNRAASPIKNGSKGPSDGGSNGVALPSPASSTPRSTAKSTSSSGGGGGRLARQVERSTGSSVAVAMPPMAKTEVLRLVVGGCSLMSDLKVDKGGEDAFFVSPAYLGAFGVADGVGGWMTDGIDPAAYAQGLMASCQELVEITHENQRCIAAVDMLDYAQRSVQLPGSSTICVAMLKEEGLLEVANLGDSGMRLLRGNKCVFSTDVQEHQFNMPFQMACPEILSMTDTAADADVYNAQLEAGDVLVMGTDGLFDNMWDEQMEELVARHIKSKRSKDGNGAQELAQLLANIALQNARNPNFKSPWSAEAARLGALPLIARLFPRGGKMDDVTAVVAFVEAS